MMNLLIARGQSYLRLVGDQQQRIVEREVITSGGSDRRADKVIKENVESKPGICRNWEAEQTRAVVEAEG